MWSSPFRSVESTWELISTPTTSKPWVAKVLAVGRPIYPKPKTQTFLNSIPAPEFGLQNLLPQFTNLINEW
jgi:hypothetical protein